MNEADMRPPEPRTGGGAAAPSHLTAEQLTRLRNGDADAGALLRDLYHDAMLRFCLSYLGTLADAEDAVQDIFVRVLGADTVPEQFRAWLYRVARNHCLNVRRARRRRRDGAPLPPVHELPDSVTGPLTRLVRDEQRSRIGRVLAALSETHREVLCLRYVEELSRTEIAEVLEIAPSRIKSRLYEAMRRLRDGTEGMH